MESEEILKRIDNAEMILVGLGEDFDENIRLQKSDVYKEGMKMLKEADCFHLIPAWKDYCALELQDLVTPALEKLKKMIEGKNYYVVATATNSKISKISWKQERIVMPCGNSSMKQCRNNCDKQIYAVSEEEQEVIRSCFRSMKRGETPSDLRTLLGKCSKCNAEMELNNIYAHQYNEEGYLPKWETYTKWLQGTLNHNLVVLELGVGLQFPSVIRWPFEKIVYFNKKAVMIRVHDTLYQLTEELSGKGYGISQNPIEWLTNL